MIGSGDEDETSDRAGSSGHAGSTGRADSSSRAGSSGRVSSADRAESSDPADLAGAVISWFAENARDLPWRRPGFTPWGTLVSEFMLQQTPVIRVVPRLAEWLERWPTPAALAASSPGDAVGAWQSLGYPRRALWLHAAAVTIVERHRGIVPREVDALLALPGVGDYTARAVSAFAYGDRHPVVDTNIRRVIARAVQGDAEPGPPNGKRDLAEMAALLPTDRTDARAFNAGMMELGAVVCTARAPKCELCPLRASCAWRAAGYPEFTGKRKTIQKKFEGSDRQVRGLILAALRARHPEAVSHAVLSALWPDRLQFDRALAGLLADGLASLTADGFTLPTS
ncbi:A/G-specific adenine glycosylase [Subtercola lobariae]|uniref:Adenine DNA glycosylase n=1 Tax=Subtercola lobariae TaxID=1588641 RepID=A0A917B7W2_9MICO|nr:A/G-specific adenine glycosylase [Subtercola lobariae]GGF25251.1 A/G-specific adenine glycosylase [Subtercola lobariae]